MYKHSQYVDIDMALYAELISKLKHADRPVLTNMIKTVQRSRTPLYL